MPASGGPFSPDHQQELLTANVRAKKIRKAAVMAAFNGWTLAVFATVSLPFSLWSWSARLLEIGLIVVAYNEFRGRNGLRRFDPAATALLGWNQLGLWAVLVGYSVWSIAEALIMPNPYEQALGADPELAGSMLGSIGDLYRAITLAVYGGMIFGTTLMQGWNAWYYFSRREHVEAYLNATPAWVLDVQRTAWTS
jgi:hypothetical protein